MSKINSYSILFLAIAIILTNISMVINFHKVGDRIAKLERLNFDLFEDSQRYNHYHTD